MLKREVLILEFLSIYRFTACSVSLCEITTLDHKAFDNTVEERALVMKGFSILADAIFTCAEGAEVFGGLGYA